MTSAQEKHAQISLRHCIAANFLKLPPDTGSRQAVEYRHHTRRQGDK